MKTKIIIVISTIVIVSLICIKTNNKSFDEFNKDNAIEYNEVSDNIGTFNEVTDDLSLIANKCIELGITGNIVYSNMETVGECVVPEFITTNNYYEWYTIANEDGITYFVIDDNGDVLSFNEE